MVISGCWFAFLLVVPLVSGMSRTEACAFVVPRLLKMPTSSCHRGECIVTRYTGTFPLHVHRPRLTCDEAVGMAYAVFAEAATCDEQPGKRRRVGTFPLEPLLETMGSVIVPGLKDFLFRGVLSEDLVLAMGAVDAGLMREASSWTRFKRVDQTRLRTASEPVVELITQIFENALIRVESMDTHAHSLGPIASFYFDLAALTQDEWDCTRVERLIQQLAVEGNIRYRARHAHEFQQPLLPATAPTASSVVSVSQAVTAMKALMAGPTATNRHRPSVDALIEFITRRQVMDEVSMTFLRDQISDDLCSDTMRLIDAVVRLFPSPIGAKQDIFKTSMFVMPILRMCRSSTSVLNPSVIVRKIQVMSGSARVNVTLPTDPDEAVEFLTTHPHRWIGSLKGSLEQANMLLGAFLSRADPLVEGPDGNQLKARDAFESDAILTGLGRAVGLVVRMGGSVVGLKFSPELVNLIHCMRLTNESTRTAESIYYFNKGAVDVLGVLGFGVFELDHLHCQFGTMGRENLSVLDLS